MAKIECTAVFLEKGSWPKSVEEITIEMPDTATSIPKRKLWETLSDQTGYSPINTMNSWELRNIQLEFKNLPWDNDKELEKSLKRSPHVNWVRPISSPRTYNKYKVGIRSKSYTDVKKHIHNNVSDNFSIRKNVTNKSSTETLKLILDPRQTLKMNRKNP